MFVSPVSVYIGHITPAQAPWGTNLSVFVERCHRKSWAEKNMTLQHSSVHFQPSFSISWLLLCHIEGVATPNADRGADRGNFKLALVNFYVVATPNTCRLQCRTAEKIRLRSILPNAKKNVAAVRGRDARSMWPGLENTLHMLVTILFLSPQPLSLPDGSMFHTQQWVQESRHNAAKQCSPDRWTGNARAQTGSWRWPPRWWSWSARCSFCPSPGTSSQRWARSSLLSKPQNEHSKTKFKTVSAEHCGSQSFSSLCALRGLGNRSWSQCIFSQNHGDVKSSSVIQVDSTTNSKTLKRTLWTNI